MSPSKPANGTAEVVRTTPSEVDSNAFTRFLAAADSEVAERNPDEVAMEIIRRILDSETVDDVLGGAGAIHARDFLSKPFALTGVKFNESSFDSAGPAFYAILEGADPNGEKVAITCGARNVIAQAWKLRDMGALPIQVVIVESPRETAAGFKPMWLEKAPISF